MSERSHIKYTFKKHNIKIFKNGQDNLFFKNYIHYHRHNDHQKSSKIPMSPHNYFF